MKNLLYSLLIPFIVFGCNEKPKTLTPNNDYAAEAMAVDTTASIASDEVDNYDKAIVSVSLPAKEKPQDITTDKITPQIIKNGTLRYETSDLETTYNQVQATVKKYNATINYDSQGKNNNSIYRNITVRVPSNNFDAFIKDVSNGVSYFDTKEISSNDVTEEYIDVQSRIKTKKALEERYLELLKKATKVSEMLEVEQQLSTIREEIESRESRLKYIKDRVATSTIDLEFYKNQAEKSGATVSYGGKIVNAIKYGFNGISSFFIWLIGVWPFIVILVAVIYLIRSRFNKKNK